MTALPRIAPIEPRLSQLTLYELVTHDKIVRPGKRYTIEDVANRIKQYTGQKHQLPAVAEELDVAHKHNLLLKARAGTDDKKAVYWRPA